MESDRERTSEGPSHLSTFPLHLFIGEVMGGEFFIASSGGDCIYKRVFEGLQMSPKHSNGVRNICLTPKSCVC